MGDKWGGGEIPPEQQLAQREQKVEEVAMEDPFGINRGTSITGQFCERIEGTGMG